jgi:DNA-binding response OmpR family regulator
MTGRARCAQGRRVLVVEDEMTIVLVIEQALQELGAELVGPTAHLETALRLATEERIDAALLDINVRGGKSHGVADVLCGREIPFAFCSGYGDWSIEMRHRDRPRLTKPFTAGDVAAVVLALLGISSG